MSVCALILDNDGTLVDSASVIVKTLQDTMQSEGYSRPSEADCLATIGLPLVKAFSILGVKNMCVEKCVSLYIHHFFPRNHTQGSIPLFPHVKETLQYFYDQGISLHIATSRKLFSLRQILTDNDVLHLFSHLITVDDVIHSKPAPDMVQLILSLTSFSPDEVLVVGDTGYDIQMGCAAGVRTCGVTYGNGKRVDFTDATYVIDDFSELRTLPL